MTEASPSCATDRQAVRRAGPALICLLFILSGGCGLAYQVVWARYLGLFVGNSVLLHATVLGTFMGGLALGSLTLGRLAARAASPLKAYGRLELAIAGYAAAFPSLAEIAHQVMLRAAVEFPPGTPVLLAVRLLLVGALLVLPTVLMGATYPFLTAHLERASGSGYRGASWLYAANCAGAVAGALITGFWLIPEMGMKATVWGCALLNAVIGIVGVGLGLRSSAAPPAGEIAAAPRPRSDPAVILAIAVSGGTAFVYELVWTRLFAVTLGSSTHSFTLMLAAFITGLALGSLLSDLAPWFRRHPLTALVLAEAAIGAAIALSIPLYPRLPYLFWKVRWMLNPVEETFGWFHLFQYVVIFAIMAVPTVLFGLTFPAAVRAAGGAGSDARPEEAPHHAATVYGWNTVGTLVGVSLAGSLLIPALGLRYSLVVAVAANLAIASRLASRRLTPGRTRHVVLGLTVVGAAAVGLGPAWHPMSFAHGSFRARRPPPATWEDYRTLVLHQKRLFYKEDFGTTVAVIENREQATGELQLGLVVDGKTDATSRGDLPTQVLLGQLPMLLHRDPQDVFVLGLGSGVTVGSVLTHPVDGVDCAEISRAVVAASVLFAEVNGKALSDPRVRLVVDDGRLVLGASPRRYDVIISEPTNPWISGVGNLFSEEFFLSAAARLKPGGIMCQWFHTYELSDPLAATIVRTFRAVFPHALVFQGNTNDMILLGSLQPIQPDFDSLHGRLRTPAVLADLQRVGIQGVPSLLAAQVHNGKSMDRIAEDGGFNTDDFPILEHVAPLALYTGSQAEKIMQSDLRAKAGSRLLLGTSQLSKPATPESVMEICDFFARSGIDQLGLRRNLLRAALQRWPRHGGLLRQQALQAAADRQPLEAIRLAAEAGSMGAPLNEQFRADMLALDRAAATTGLLPPPAPSN